MTRPAWDLDDWLSSIDAQPWQGSVWRAHRRRYQATDPGGSLRVSGRYNRGLDQFPEELTWAALYLALSPEGALGEILRHISPEILPSLNDYRLIELDVQLSAVLDCRNIAEVGLNSDGFVGDYDFEPSQQVAAAATARAAEAILVPSATQLGSNLIVFPANLRSTSRLIVLGSRDPGCMSLDS